MRMNTAGAKAPFRRANSFGLFADLFLILISSVFRIFQSRVRWATLTARKSPIRARTVARCTITTPAWQDIWSTNVAWNQNSTVPSALTERSTNPAWTPTWMADIWNFWANSTRCQMGISCRPLWTLEINLLRQRSLYFLLEIASTFVEECAPMTMNFPFRSTWSTLLCPWFIFLQFLSFGSENRKNVFLLIIERCVTRDARKFLLFNINFTFVKFNNAVSTTKHVVSFLVRIEEVLQATVRKKEVIYSPHCAPFECPFLRINDEFVYARKADASCLNMRLSIYAQKS